MNESPGVPLPYEHTQPGKLTRFALGLPIVFLVVVVIAAEDEPTGRTIAATVMVVLSLALICFHSLTTRVTEESAEALFGPGFPRFRYDISEIVDAEAVRNPWFIGWGIRWFPGGWLYNVSGLDAVQIELRSGVPQSMDRP
ncbi:MAG: hypothetical protein AAF488_05970 [Planctomycetota bacterium]